MQTPKKYIRSVKYIIKDAIKKFNIACAYCGKPYNNKRRKVSIDHIRPKCRHGCIELKNIVVCCVICNNIKKGSLSLEEFIKINPKSKYFLNKYLSKIKNIEANNLNYYEELKWIKDIIDK